MKKAIICALIGIASVTIFSCDSNKKSKTHTHEDGSAHADHDTTKPEQQEFTVGDTMSKDTTGKEHTHKDGEKHSH
jgi:hypothetical protein